MWLGPCRQVHLLLRPTHLYLMLPFCVMGTSTPREVPETRSPLPLNFWGQSPQ